MATSVQFSQLTHAVVSDVGRRRDENQDSFGILDSSELKGYFVADGMGGARGGAIASGLAVEIMKTSLRGRAALSDKEIGATVSQANSSIYERGSSDPSLNGMGTTIVGMVFTKEAVFGLSVGDSRLYRIRAGTVTRLTEDHTLVNELVKSGAISPDQAKNHPVAHMLTRSLGPSRDVKVDCWALGDVADSDRYLMCSDGLYNLVVDEDIGRVAGEGDLTQAAQKLVDMANEAGGTDNITVMIVHIAPPVASISEGPKEEPKAPEVAAEPISLVAPKVEEVTQPTSDSEPKQEVLEDKSSNSRRKLIVLMAITAISIVLTVAISLRGTTTQQPTSAIPLVVPTSIPSVAATVDNPTPVVTATVFATSTATPVSTTVVVTAVSTPDLEPTATEAPVLKQGLEAVDQKKSQLNLELQRYKQSLALYELSSDQLTERENKLSADIQSAQEALSDLNQKIQIAKDNRKEAEDRVASLSKLETLKAASELENESPKISDLRSQFEKATADYVDIVSRMKLEPTNLSLSTEMQEKLKMRKESLDALKSGVEGYIASLTGAKDSVIQDLEDKKAAADAKAKELTEQKDSVTQLKVSASESRATERKKIEERLKQLNNDLNQLG